MTTKYVLGAYVTPRRDVCAFCYKDALVLREEGDYTVCMRCNEVLEATGMDDLERCYEIAVNRGLDFKAELIGRHIVKRGNDEWELRERQRQAQQLLNRGNADRGVGSEEQDAVGTFAPGRKPSLYQNQ